MGIYYKQIASITIQHDYYSNKALKLATIHPTTETALFFKNYRMLFKRKGDSYFILQETQVEDQLPVISIESGIPLLTFGIKFNDEHYQVRSGLIFSPREKKIAIEIGPDPEVIVSSENVMPYWESLPGGADKKIAITGKNGLITVSSETNGGIQFNELPNGIYKYNELPFFKATNCSLYNAALFFTLIQSEESINYVIRFPSGNYHWRYHILKKHNQYNELSIAEENELIVFNEVKGTNESQTSFYSKEPVRLAEQSKISISLYNNESIIKKYLPIPELTNARFFSAEEKTLVLEAYITI